MRSRRLAVVAASTLFAVMATVLFDAFASHLAFLDTLLFSLRPVDTPGGTSQIVLVLIEHERHRRSEYARAIAHIQKGGPRIIGIDVFFAGRRSDEEDIALLDALDRAERPIVLSVIPVESAGLLVNLARIVAPNSAYTFRNLSLGNTDVSIREPLAGITKAVAIPSRDGRGNEYLPFPILVASKYLQAEYRQEAVAADTLVGTLGGIRLPPGYGMRINYIGGVEAFERVPLDRVVTSNPEVFRDKIVLMGGGPGDKTDLLPSPLGAETPGVVILANAVHTIINERFLHEAPRGYQLSAAFVLALIMTLLAARAPGLRAGLIGGCVLLLYGAGALYVLSEYRQCVPVIPAAMSTAFSYCAMRVCCVSLV